MLVLNNQPRTNNQVTLTMKRYRMIIMLHCLRNIPLDIDLSQFYSLEFEVFNQRVKIKLDLMQLMIFKDNFLLTINSLRMFYFFCVNQKDIYEFFASKKVKKKK